MNPPAGLPKTNPCQPRFSVVVPLYNKEDTVARALESVLNQTVQDFEVVVVNDGSTDKGRDLVERMDEPRIRLVHQTNRGVSAARNFGVSESKSEWIAFLDADDEWLPGFLETIGGLMARYPQCGLYATRYFFVPPSGPPRAATVQGLDENFEGVLDNYFRIAARSDPPVCSSAVCVRKIALSEIGGFPVGVPSGEDLLTWAKIAVKHPVAYSMSCMSNFHQPFSRNQEMIPTRTPAQNDVVGKGLGELLEMVCGEEKNSLRHYCSLWHKMRASCYLRLGFRLQARKEIFRAFRFKRGVKMIVYGILSFLPLSWVRKIFSAGMAKR